MGEAIKTISIEGFKSIRKVDNLELGPLNVMIGANGAGKSNFVDFFRLLRAMVDQGLSPFVKRVGGADSLFYLGPKYTPKIIARLQFGDDEYRFEAEPTANNDLLIADEKCFGPGAEATGYWMGIRNGENLSAEERSNISDRTPSPRPNQGADPFLYGLLSGSKVYHFHDTSLLALARREWLVRDFDYLRPDAANIAPYLLFLRNNRLKTYELILHAVRLIAPFFDDFRFRPELLGAEEKVRLEWTQKGSDFPFQPSHLSDGILRFICITTALSQPDPPATILIDEPELGLHPHALEVVAGLLKKAATRTQVVVCTQSATLLSQFNPEDVIVVTRRDEASEFHRMNPQQLAEWLEEYTLGELWQKNYLEGARHMARILALVEGPTERNFGQKVLAPHLYSSFRIEFHPRVIGIPGHKGGVGPWDRAKKEITKLIRQEPSSVVTTMFDLYGLPKSWPGRKEAVDRGLKNEVAVAFIEKNITDAIRLEFKSFEPRFVPYLSQHEYEALLFSDPMILAGVTQGDDHAEKFQEIVNQCGECEKIDDSPATAPSKRLLNIASSYQKTVDGIIAAERIGLQTMRQKCRHFDAWLSRLESFAES